MVETGVGLVQELVIRFRSVRKRLGGHDGGCGVARSLARSFRCLDLSGRPGLG